MALVLDSSEKEEGKKGVLVSLEKLLAFSL
jgi:hypothetical protein